MWFFLLLFQAATAIITAPTTGQAVTGTVDIIGTAADPQFARYEVAFAYDPNPTDSWFDLQPASTTAVQAGVLASWDTTQITDGDYMLRLRVFVTGSNAPTETIIRGIQVRNDAPTPTPTLPTVVQPSLTPSATTTFLQTTATPLPQPSPTESPISPSVTPGTSSPLPAFLNLSIYTSAFCNGVTLAFGAFLILGLYVILRDRIRRPFRRWVRRIMSDSRKP